MKLNIQKDIFLEKYITLKTRAHASFFVVVKSIDELKEALSFAKDNKLSFFILGGGSNVFFREEFCGLVIKIEIFGKTVISKNADNVIIKASAGESWDEFVCFCILNNAFGLENLSGIPGTVGASAVQNIGAYGVEVKDFIDFVEVLDTNSLETKKIENKDLLFDYRDSLFKKTEGKSLVVLNIVWRLKKIFSPNISYKDLSIFFKDNVPKAVIDVRDAIIGIRLKKFPDLNIYGTAGSFFKNIIVGKSDLERVLELYKDLVFFDLGSGNYKISSAWILDKVCGLKGLKEGDVGLFNNQPLVVVNYGKASSYDIDQFANKIKEIVFAKTGLSIEREVVLA